MTKHLVDTGPLVAFLNARDRHHAWTVQQLSSIKPPLLTCEAVLSEAFFLLRKHDDAVTGLLKLLNRGIVSVAFRLDEEHVRVGKLLNRYTNVQMSLADACLVRMSELYAECRLLTFDSDFQIYRRNGRQVVPLISPP